MEENLLLSMEDLFNNPSARVPVCLCLDISGSMYGNPISELNEGIQMFYNAIKEDEMATYSAEISIVTFESVVKCIQDFATVEKIDSVEKLEASGATAMGEGVNLALDLLEKRKKQYQNAGVDYYQPWLVLMTDGEPNGSISELERAIERTVDLVENKKLTVFPIGIGNDADMSVLAKFSPKRSPLKLRGLRFKEFFNWLSQSVSRTSQSIPGENVLLDTESIFKEDGGWGSLEL